MRLVVALLLAGVLTLDSDSSSPLVSNGTLDAASLDGWVANSWAYSGRSVDPVTKLSQLGLVASNAAPAVFAAYGAERTLYPNGMTLSDLNSTPPKIPFAGTGCAGINMGTSNGAATTLSTTFSVAASHFSAIDGRLRVRLRGLPTFVHDRTLSKGTESFVFVTIDNVTTGANDIASYYLGQSAINSTGLYYSGQTTNGIAMAAREWIDLPMMIALRDVTEGDQLRLTAVASSCAAGYGNSSAQLYIDSVEAQAKAPMLTLIAPQFAATNSVYKQTLLVEHGSTGSDRAKILRLVVPGDVMTLTKIVPTAPWTCDVDSNAQRVTCNAPSLDAGKQSSIELQSRTRFNEQTANIVAYVLDDVMTTNGNMVVTRLQSGMERSTQVVSNRALTNVAVTSAVDAASAQGGDGAISLTVVNQGPSAASGVTLSDVASVALGGRSYACKTSGGAQINGQSTSVGNGAMTLTLNLPAQAQVVCVTRIPANAASPQTALRYGATLGPPNGAIDINSWDNEHATVFRLSDIAANAVAQSSAPRNSGIACLDASQCASGFCVDGVCCASQCLGPCEACNVEGSLGSCMPIDGESPDGHVGCGPYACRAGSCEQTCESDNDCLTLYHCASLDNVNQCVATTDVCVRDSDCPTGRYCTPAKTCESPATQDPQRSAWSLAGGCRSGGDGLLALASLVPWWAWRRRRRQRSVVISIALLFGATLHAPMANAASALAMPLERLQVLGGRNDVFNVASARIAQQTITSHAQLDLQYLSKPLRLKSTQHNAQTIVVPRMAVLELAGGVMLRRGVELDAVLPVIWHATRAAPFVSSDLKSSTSEAGLGDLRITPKWSPFPWRRLHVGVAVPVSIMTSHGRRFLSTGGVSVSPRLMFEARLPARVSVLVNAGYLFRPKRQVIGLLIKDAVHVAFALAWVLPKRAQAFTLMAGAWSEIPIGGSRYGKPLMEGLVGLRARLVDEWSLEATYGGALMSAPGVPAARAMVAIRYAERTRHKKDVPVAAPAPLPEPEPDFAALPQEPEGPPYTPPATSADPVDVPLIAPALVPPAASASHPFADAPVLEEEALPLLLPAPKAKPTPLGHGDRDKDGVPDAKDVCPDVFGPREAPHAGCPATLELANKALARRPIPYVIRGQYAAFDAAAEHVMEEIRQVLAAHATATVRITGHVAAVKEVPDAQREHLSVRRAEEVARWFGLHGIAKERIRLEGHGSRDAMDASGTPEALAKNRRVEVRLE